MKKKISTVLPKIRRFAEIAEELRRGKSFSITRLTTIKSLYNEPDTSAHFVLHFSKLTQEKMENRDCPNYINPEKWLQYKILASQAIIQMENYLEGPSNENESILRDLLYRIQELQNQYDNQQWGPVRIIESNEALLVEYALRCIVFPSDSSYWSYLVARQYAERYDSSYGTGLIPESAPMVEEIAHFWSNYYLGKPLNEWLAKSPIA